MTTRECTVCGAPFRAARPSSPKRTCSKACANRLVSRYQSTRTGEANSNWRGGKASHPLYDIYVDMTGRCHRPAHPRYADYGGRGIRVCAEWRADFWAFVRDMGPRPEGKSPKGRALFSLDRIDNGKGYEPTNCRWATNIEQRHNRRPERLPAACGNDHPYPPCPPLRANGSRRCLECERQYAREARQRRAAA